MSRTLTLNPPFQGLSTIVNVLKRVGPTEINDPSDVKVVQALIRMHTSAFAKKVGVPQVTGNFDAATGFYIYDTQYFLKPRPAIKAWSSMGLFLRRWEPLTRQEPLGPSCSSTIKRKRVIQPNTLRS